MNKLLLLVVFVSGLLYANGTLTATQQTDMLNLHKTRRSQVNPPASNMKTMVWNSCVKDLAQAHANKCVWQHSTTASRTKKCGFSYIGENIAYGGGGSTGAYSPSQGGGTKMINMWWAEKAYYTYSSNSCASGKVCGHYTQMAWASSNNLGCAHKSCSWGEFYVCNYGPGGNYVGQKPYAKKTSRDSFEERVSCGTEVCDANAYCDTTLNACVCNNGFDGNGTLCYFPDPLFLSGFEVARGSDDWTLTVGGIDDSTIDYNDDGESKQLFYSGVSETANILHWIPSDLYTSLSATIATVQFTPEDTSSTDFGLCMRYQDKDNMACFTCDANKLIVSVIFEGEETRQDYDIPCNTFNGTNTLSVSDLSTYFQIYLNDARVGPTVLIPFFKNSGGVALRTQGLTTFQDLSVLTKKRLVATLVSCMNATEFRTKIATILGVNETMIDNVVVSDTCSAGLFQVTFTINGNNWISADSLFGRLNTMVLTNDTLLKESGLQIFQLQDTQVSATPQDAVEFKLFTQATIVQSVALSVGVIVGIAIGVAVIVAVIGITGKKGYDYYAHRSSVALSENATSNALYLEPANGKNPFYDPKKDSTL